MKTIKERLVLKNRYVEFYNNEIETKSGKKGEHIIFGRHGDNETCGVNVLPLNKEGEVYIFQEFRYGTNDYIWTTVAGGVEDGLTIEENAKKELEEETGLTAMEFEHINIQAKNDPSIKNNLVNFYIAKNCVKIKEKDVLSDDTEDFINGHWININELVNKIVSGEMLFTLSALPLIFYYYANKK